MNSWHDENERLPWDISETPSNPVSNPNAEKERSDWFKQHQSGNAKSSAVQPVRFLDPNRGMKAMAKLRLPPYFRWQPVEKPDERVLKITHRGLLNNFISFNVIFVVFFIVTVIFAIKTDLMGALFLSVCVVIADIIFCLVYIPKLKPTWIVFKKHFIEIGKGKTLPIIRTQIPAEKAITNCIVDGSSTSENRHGYRRTTYFYAVTIDDNDAGISEKIAHKLDRTTADMIMDFMDEAIALDQECDE